VNILILGAGQVGGTLAEHLASEAFDITVVDIDGDRLRDLRDRLDIRTIHGHASHPDVLRAAGAPDADMLIAVTPNDEVNMVACQVCYSMFRTPTKIARIRADSYRSGSGFFTKDHMPIDVLINPEHVVTEQIRQLLEHPGALQVLDFADGRVKLVAVKATPDSPLIGQDLGFLHTRLPKVDSRVAAIFRRGRAIIPEGATIIQADDEVFFLAAARDINAVMAVLRHVERPYKRVLIAGGGHIGEQLAKAIEPDFSVKVVEYDPIRAAQLAQRLESAVVIAGNATDKALLVSVYVTLALSGMIGDLIVILVVFRDVLIVGSVLLLLVLRRHWEVRPTMVSKINTGMQILFAAMVLAQAGIPAAMPGAVALAGYAVVATTVASGGWYLVVWARQVAGVEAGR